MKNVILASILVPINIIFFCFTLQGQMDTNFSCIPKEITLQKFKEITNRILTYSPVKQASKTMSLERDCIMFITNDLDANSLYGLFFYLGSGLEIENGFFTKLVLNDNNGGHLEPLKKRQIKKFKGIIVDTTINQFFYCRTSSVHEKWDVAAFFTKGEYRSGLYIIGNPFPEVNFANKHWLFDFRKRVKGIRLRL